MDSFATNEISTQITAMPSAEIISEADTLVVPETSQNAPVDGKSPVRRSKTKQMSSGVESRLTVWVSETKLA